MSYIKKHSPSLKKENNINLNLIKAILSSISDHNSLCLYNSNNFQDILKLMSPEDIELFKTPCLNSASNNKNNILTNIIQHPLLKLHAYFTDFELTEETYQKIKQSLNNGNFEETLYKYATISNHNDKLKENTEKIKNLFMCWSDIEDVLNIKVSDYIIKETVCLIESFNIENTGFKKRDYTLSKQLDIFSSFAIINQQIPVDINIFGKNISNCENILFIINNGINNYNLQFNKNPSSYDYLYSNILVETKNLTTLGTEDISIFNQKLINSDYFSTIIKNNLFPSPELAFEFKEQFDKINPNYYLFHLTKSEHKGFKILDELIQKHHNPIDALDKYYSSLIKSKAISHPIEIFDRLFFSFKSDKDCATKNTEKGAKTNNSYNVSPQFFSVIKQWADKHEFDFDTNHKFLTSILNTSKYSNLINYLDAFEDERELGEKLSFIQSAFGGKKSFSFVINNVKTNNETFFSHISEYVLEKTIPVKDNNSLKLSKF